MIAPLRIDTDERNPMFAEPRRIGELLPQLLAERGIKMPEERHSDPVETIREFTESATGQLRHR